tara:strand:- start:232 stop:564 length:333 start_codon:yes stop_codon:yes gene_type:complete
VRYLNQLIFKNTTAAYKRYLKKRGMSHIFQFTTPKFKYPSQEDMKKIETITHIWGVGDRYFKLADKYYGDAELWWVIAFFNQKPTEFDINAGDIIYIPTPLETTLFYMGY